MHTDLIHLNSNLCTSVWQTNTRESVCFSSSLFIFVKYDVPKELILGSTLFKIFLCDIFVIVIDIDIASYDDDNTHYCTNDAPEDLKITLKTVSVNLFQRFYENGMKADIDKVFIS